MASGPTYTYDAYIIAGGQDLSLSGAGTPNLTATYHDYGGIGEAVTQKAACTISVNYANLAYTINNDNSITVTGNINGAVLVRSKIADSSNTQEITAWFNNQQVFHTYVDTGSSGTYDLNIPSSFSVTIPPSLNPQAQWPASIHFKNHNTGAGTRPPDEFYVGLGITNPNPPDYRPGQCLHSGTWESHNRSGGSANVLRSGTWTEMRTLNGGDASGDPPTIRTNGDWKNQRKIGANA